MDSAANSAYSLTDLTPILDELGLVLSEFEAADLAHKLNERDFTLWSEDPTEIADRLGWLDCPSSMQVYEQRLRNFRADIVAEAYDHVVVLGMGGSSLFPEVLSVCGAGAASGPELSILDSTHPAAVKRCIGLADQHKVLFIAASKSGGTIETRSQLDCLWDAVGTEKDFVAITDPGTELAMLAHDRNFRACFENPANIGGRYSALSLFGLVPGAACGVDVAKLLSGGGSALHENGLGTARVPISESGGILLGAVLAAAERSGRNKLTLLFGGEMAALNVWVDQLIAESSGKQGRGLLPVVDEWIVEGTDGNIEDFSSDRVFVAWGFHNEAFLEDLVTLGHPVVNLGLDTGLEALGREVMLWEIAAATLGVGLGCNPFDQPDVGAAKSATAQVLQSGAEPVRTETLPDLLAGVNDGDYMALLAYVDSGDPRALRSIRKIRSELSRRYKVPVTLGIGPRYLHCTGQFHKGGTVQGRFIQVVEPAAFDIRVPGTYMRFGQLMNAQADGDIKALVDVGRPVTRVDIQDLEEFLAQSA